MSRLFDDALSQYLEVAVPVVTTTPFTIACWFYADAVALDHNLVTIADTAGGADRHWLDVSSADKVQANSRLGSSVSALTSTTISINTWHLAVGVWAAANDRRVFLDGGGKGTDTGSRSPTGLDTTAIGRRVDNTPDEYWSGRIAEVLLLNVALSDAEVAALMNVRLSTVRPRDQAGYWPLWGLHSTEIDLSGNGNEMIVTGATKADHAPVTLWTPKWAASTPLIEVAAGGGLPHVQAVIIA